MSAIPEPNKPSKGILTKKLGPLPTWGWMAVGLGVAVIIASVTKGKGGGTSSKSANGGTGDQSGSAGGADTAYGPDLIGGNQRAPVVFQNYTTTLNNIPPAAGRPFPPCGPVGPPCPPSGQAGEWIVLSSTRHGKAQWRSSVQGCAQELLGDRSQWRTIWNDPQNASLRFRRRDPGNCHAGDRIWIPECGPSGAPCGPSWPGGAVACPPAPGGIGMPCLPPPIAGQPTPFFPPTQLGIPPAPPPPPPMPMGPPPPPPGPPQHAQPPGRSGGQRYSRSGR